MSDAAHPFRFGHQLRPADGIDVMIEEARLAEAAGFDIVTIPDHIGATMDSPMMVLAAIARETETIRLGTFVLNNEMRNPVQLAWEASTLDRLSGGRFELGIGAGHTPHEFAATGIEFAPPAIRKERLGEAIEIIRGLLDGDTVDSDGEHYQVEAAAIQAAAQTRLPIMEAGNGTALLTHAAQHADIVGLNGLGRTQADGQRHSVKFEQPWLDHQVETIRTAAADAERTSLPELNALVQRIVVTDDRNHAAAETAENIDGLAVEDALTTPYLAFGTHDEIVEHFRTVRERWGISYFVSRDVEAMTPVVAALT